MWLRLFSRFLCRRAGTPNAKSIDARRTHDALDEQSHERSPPVICPFSSFAINKAIAVCACLFRCPLRGSERGAFDNATLRRVPECQSASNKSVRRGARIAPPTVNKSPFAGRGEFSPARAQAALRPSPSSNCFGGSSLAGRRQHHALQNLNLLAFEAVELPNYLRGAIQFNFLEFSNRRSSARDNGLPVGGAAAAIQASDAKAKRNRNKANLR